MDNPASDLEPMDETVDLSYVALLKNHQLLQTLIGIYNFYKHVAYNCFLFIPKGVRSICNYNSYIYDSFAGTTSSISSLVVKGHLNDTCVLLRVYFDNILTGTYINLIAEEKGNVFTNFYVDEVEKWLHMKFRIPSVKKVLTIIETNEKAKTIYSLVNKDNRLKEYRDFLDACVHGNRFQTLLYNCGSLCLEHRDRLLLKIQTILNTLFVLHLSFIFSLNPHYLMASDYNDCLEMGMTPPLGSEYWIAPFAQDAFDKYIKPNQALANYIYENCSLEIKR